MASDLRTVVRWLTYLPVVVVLSTVHLLDIRHIVIGMLETLVIVCIMLRQVGPITMILVFRVRLSVALCSVLWLPVGLRRQAWWLFRRESLIVLWKGLQSVEAHPVVQVRTVASMKFVELSVLCIVFIRLLTTLSAFSTLVFVWVRIIVTRRQWIKAVLPLILILESML